MTPDDVRKLREQAALTGTPSFDDIPGIEHQRGRPSRIREGLSGHGRRAKTRGTLKPPRRAAGRSYGYKQGGGRPGSVDKKWNLRHKVKVVKVTEWCVEVELLRAEGPIGLKYGIRFDTNGKACDSSDIYEGNIEWGGIPGTYECGPWELAEC